MNNTINYLQDFWLTELEAKVYEKSISLWNFAASNIANILKIPRSTARYTCETLVNKWFMQVNKKANTKYFLAENPTKLFAILYDEEEKLKQKKSKLNNIVTELQNIYNPKAKIPKITIYEWLDWIEKMFDNLVENQTTLYSFWAWDYFLQKEEEFIKKFRKKSIKSYDNVYIIRAPKYEKLHKNDVVKQKTKYFKHIEELKIDIQIVDDKMTITSLWEPTPIWILIKHKEIIDAFKQIFTEIWKKLD